MIHITSISTPKKKKRKKAAFKKNKPATGGIFNPVSLWGRKGKKRKRKGC